MSFTANDWSRSLVIAGVRKSAHLRTYAPQQTALLFDNPAGATREGGR